MFIRKATLPLVIGTLFCLLLTPLAPASAEGAAPQIDDAAILRLFYPSAAVEAQPDFWYTVLGVSSEPGMDGDLVHRVKEVKRFGNLYLIVLESHGGAHSSGYQNYTFGVYDPAQGAITGEVMKFGADKAEYALFYRDGVLSVLYAGSTTYTGLEACSGGRWAWANGAWQLCWPRGVGDVTSEAYQDYWARRKAEIGYQDGSFADGVVLLYQRVPIAGGGLGDYTWEQDGMGYEDTF